ncbi:MAG: hypothetical protein ACRDTN_21425, partial [Mycobacterium sp.]
MQAAGHQQRYVATGVALAVASIVAVTPVAPVPWPSGTSVVDRAVRLVADGDSILNIPFNLFQDIVNIPNAEVEAANVAASALFFSGNWWTPNATNLLGTDPGDPGHYMGIIDTFIPFPEISGLGQPEIDPTADAAGTAGLAQQLALLAAAELPTTASCAADWCSPMIPVTPITGLSMLDRTIWLWPILLGGQHFPLVDNWFQVPLSDLTNGFTFDPTTDPSGLADPAKGVGPNGSVPSDDVFGLPGTQPGPDGENLMPWAGIDFKLNLLGPFQNFFNSLLAPPDFSGFEFPSLSDIVHAAQSLLASAVVAFDPWIGGSLQCFGECLWGFPVMVDVVRAIGSVFPGNTLINHWLDLVDTPNPNSQMEGAQSGMANAATPHQIDALINYLQGQQLFGFDFGNPPPSDPPTSGPLAVDTPAPFNIDQALQDLIQVMQD